MRLSALSLSVDLHQVMSSELSFEQPLSFILEVKVRFLDAVLYFNVFENGVVIQQLRICTTILIISPIPQNLITTTFIEIFVTSNSASFRIGMPLHIEDGIDASGRYFAGVVQLYRLVLLIHELHEELWLAVLVAARDTHRVDASQMLVEVLEPVEPALTLRLVANVPLLVIVSILVFDLIAFGGEPPVAQLTLEGLLAGVDSGVHLQIGQLIELHSADLHAVNA